jgi:hypothetical protein
MIRMYLGKFFFTSSLSRIHNFVSSGEHVKVFCCNKFVNFIPITAQIGYAMPHLDTHLTTFFLYIN